MTQVPTDLGDGAGGGLRPWLPPSLTRDFTAETVSQLSYVLLDEIVAGIVMFLVHPWPGADSLGRVRFGHRDEQFTVAVREDTVHRQLYRRFRQRSPRPGDLFAARVRPQVLDRAAGGVPGPGGPAEDHLTVDDLAAVFDGTLYDLSAEGRVVAKLAYYGSLSAVIPERKVPAWGVVATQQDPTGPAPARRLGDRR